MDDLLETPKHESAIKDAFGEMFERTSAVKTSLVEVDETVETFDL